MIHPISNEVLANEIGGVKELVFKVEKKLDNFIDRFEKVEAWKYMVSGALIIMNIFLVPVAIWAIITLITKALTH